MDSTSLASRSPLGFQQPFDFLVSRHVFESNQQEWLAVRREDASSNAKYFRVFTSRPMLKHEALVLPGPQFLKMGPQHLVHAPMNRGKIRKQALFQILAVGTIREQKALFVERILKSRSTTGKGSGILAIIDWAKSRASRSSCWLRRSWSIAQYCRPCL
ncbi:MAG: hypothetical protein ACJ73N_11785 [Bryobacteraceae bacterium]